MILLSTGSLQSFMQLLGVVVIFIFVLVITYLTTRWIANYQKGHSYNKNLKIIETLKLTPNKYVQIIEAGEVYLVVAIGKDEVNLLATLTKDQLKELPEEGVPSTQQTYESFHEVLEKVKKHLPKK